MDLNTEVPTYTEYLVYQGQPLMLACTLGKLTCDHHLTTVCNIILHSAHSSDSTVCQMKTKRLAFGNCLKKKSEWFLRFVDNLHCKLKALWVLTC